MRQKIVVGLALIAAGAAAFALPAQAQTRRAPAGDTETITVIDETGRTRTKVTVRPRWLLGLFLHPLLVPRCSSLLAQRWTTRMWWSAVRRIATQTRSYNV